MILISSADTGHDLTFMLLYTLVNDSEGAEVE